MESISELVDYLGEKANQPNIRRMGAKNSVVCRHVASQIRSTLSTAEERGEDVSECRYLFNKKLLELGLPEDFGEISEAKPRL